MNGVDSWQITSYNIVVRLAGGAQSKLYCTSHLFILMVDTYLNLPFKMVMAIQDILHNLK